MTVTSTQYKNSASSVQVCTGSYITDGTAAAITITLGFAPLFVKVYNTTIASESGCSVEWVYPMADASGYKLHDAGTSEAGWTVLTTLGITRNSNGFVIGLDTDLNVTSEQLYWIAIG